MKPTAEEMEACRQHLQSRQLRVETRLSPGADAGDSGGGGSGDFHSPASSFGSASGDGADGREAFGKRKLQLERGPSHLSHASDPHSSPQAETTASAPPAGPEPGAAEGAPARSDCCT